MRADYYPEALAFWPTLRAKEEVRKKNSSNPQKTPLIVAQTAFAHMLRIGSRNERGLGEHPPFLLGFSVTDLELQRKLLLGRILDNISYESLHDVFVEG